MTDMQLPVVEPLTVADIDEWIASIEESPAYAGVHVPYDWARAALGAVLGEDIPRGAWLAKELLATLRRARTVAARLACDEVCVCGECWADEARQR